MKLPIPSVCKKNLRSVLCLAIIIVYGSAVNAQYNKIDFFGRKPAAADTIPYLDLFDVWKWDAKFFLQGDQPIRQMQQIVPDTLTLERGEWLMLETRCIASATMLNKIYTLKYNIHGSAIIMIDGEKVLATGSFADRQIPGLLKTNQHGYLNFHLRDTVLSIKITYRQDNKVTGKRMSLVAGAASWGEEDKKAEEENIYLIYAIGAFYAAFAIVFFLFYLFSHNNRENLYFALFCLFASISFLVDMIFATDVAEHIANYALLTSIEFLSFFIAIILLDKEKTKIPLIIILVLGTVTCHPFFLYGNGNFYFLVAINLMYLVLMLGVIIYGLYILLNGFGKKKWEANVIIRGSLIGFIIGFVLPFILIFFYASKYERWKSEYKLVAYLPYIGFAVYPLTAAYVIGRRNGINQTQLITHVKQIEKLSHENLKSELEKKKILEDQNLQLEHKVNERTLELLTKNEVITVKNKEITDSLIYAKRIQSAILPDKNILYTAFTDSFILYLPKDIVSGDFYNFSVKENSIIVVCADCTGHGVAGAFMSMIGTSLLNQIIVEKKITQPSHILNELNDGIIKALRQKESDTNDGMDICIGNFDLANMTAQFAGANRPLILVRNGAIEIIKPDKFAIGGLKINETQTFTHHTFELKKNDSFYFFTDGYADQFGGLQGKKMMVRNFKDQLLAINPQSMSDQKKYLRDFFMQWRGGHDQVDDVLVIGLKI